MNRTQLKYMNIALMVCAMACLVYYDIAGGLWLKGVTSSWFVLLGSINLWAARKLPRHQLRFSIWMVLGLFCGMCADVLLGKVFFVGVGVFALGHIWYLAAFCCLEPFRRRDWIFILPLTVFSMLFILKAPWLSVEDPFMQKLLLGYAAIISAMLGKAISNLTVRPSTARWILMVASILFWFSDMILAIDMFGQSSRLTWILCSYSYWPAQSLLAHSLFHTQE